MSHWVHRLTEIDPMAETAICAACGPVGIYRKPSDTTWKCREKRKVERRKYRGKARFRTGTNEDRVRMSSLQGGSCAICGSQEDILNLDHDHLTGKFRGMLCTLCNTGLGSFQDSPEILEIAAIYIST